MYWVYSKRKTTESHWNHISVWITGIEGFSGFCTNQEDLINPSKTTILKSFALQIDGCKFGEEMCNFLTISFVKVP